MSTTGFAGAATTKYILFALIITSLLAGTPLVSQLANNPLLVHPANVSPYPYPWAISQDESYLEFPLHIHHTCYANPVSLFFACVLLYQMRVVERLWATRKFLSFLLYAAPLAYVLPLVQAAMAPRDSSYQLTEQFPLTLHEQVITRPPAAFPLTLLFALLAQYHSLVPWEWQYQSATLLGLDDLGLEAREHGSDWKIVPSAKWTVYAVAAQMALSGGSANAQAALVGWLVGVSWELVVERWLGLSGMEVRAV